MSDLVLVKSKTINNEAIPIVFQVAEVKQGKVMDERELSRSYVFEEFQAKIPLKYAKLLVKQSPKEFRIVKTVSKHPSKKALKTVKSAKEKTKGFVCEICNTKAKSKAGLNSHIRYNHPDQWNQKGEPKKVKQKSKPKEIKQGEPKKAKKQDEPK